MRIAISDRSPLIYMLEGEQLNVVSHQKDLGIVVDHQLKFYQHTACVASKGFWASLVNPLNVLMLIPYLELWYAQLLNMPIQFGVPITLVNRGC